MFRAVSCHDQKRTYVEVVLFEERAAVQPQQPRAVDDDGARPRAGLSQLLQRMSRHPDTCHTCVSVTGHVCQVWSPQVLLVTCGQVWSPQVHLVTCVHPRSIWSHVVSCGHPKSIWSHVVTPVPSGQVWSPQVHLVTCGQVWSPQVHLVTCCQV